jgi:uncharacterized protein YecT (DUF1311 family)
MHRIVTALGLLLLMSAPIVPQKEFEPTAFERKTISDCSDKTAGDSELEQMSKCIGLIADPCVDAPNANTFTIVACNMRELTIWDGRLNEWYGQAQSRLKDDAAAAAALKDAQCAWIQFRDAKCGYWEKGYEGGTFASVATGNCTRIETGRRALELRSIFEDLDYLKTPNRAWSRHISRCRYARLSRSGCCRSSFQNGSSGYLPGALRPGRRQICPSPQIASQ